MSLLSTSNLDCLFYDKSLNSNDDITRFDNNAIKIKILFTDL